LLGIMGHIPDDDEPWSIVQRLMDGLASGSYLVLGHGTSTSEDKIEAHRRYNESGAVPYNLRSPEAVARLFDRLDLVEPGVVETVRWRRQEPDPSDVIAPIHDYCGVARKP